MFVVGTLCACLAAAHPVASGTIMMVFVQPLTECPIWDVLTSWWCLYNHWLNAPIVMYSQAAVDSLYLASKSLLHVRRNKHGAWWRPSLNVLSHFLRRLTVVHAFMILWPQTVIWCVPLLWAVYWAERAYIGRTQRHVYSLLTADPVVMRVATEDNIFSHMYAHAACSWYPPQWWLEELYRKSFAVTRNVCAHERGDGLHPQQLFRHRGRAVKACSGGYMQL